MSAKRDRKGEFEQIALVHTNSLLRVARRMLQNAHAAEDAVQETLLSAWRTFDRFESGTNCKAWLFRILMNYLHKSYSRPRLSLVDLSESMNIDNVVPIRSDFSSLAQSDAIAAIESLHPEQRAVLLLAAVEGFTCKEIGVMLDIPIGTVMSRLSRGRAELRRELYPFTASNKISTGGTA